MPDILQTQCPHCQSSMKLKSRGALGKQAPCPKCKKPFLVKEVPSEPVEEYEEDGLIEEYDTGDTSVDDEFDEYDDDGGEDDDESRRRPRRSKKKSDGKKRRKKQKSNGRIKPALLIGGSVLGVVVLGLGIWLVWGMFSRKLDLAWLPPDAKNISITRPSAEWNSMVGRTVSSEHAEKILAKEREMFGVCQTDIVSITSAGGGIGKEISVVRSSADLDPVKILENALEHEKIEYKDQEYYRVRGVERFGRVASFAIFFPDRRTAIHGKEAAIKEAIDRGPKPVERKELEFVDAGYDKVDVYLHSGQWSRLDEVMDDAKPVAIVLARDFGATSAKSRILAKFETESEATAAYEATLSRKENELKKWESSAKDEFRQSLRTAVHIRTPELKYTEAEIDDALHRYEKRLNSRSISRSGRVVSIKQTAYASKHDERVAEYHLSKRRLYAESSAITWGRSTFGSVITLPQTRQRQKTKIEAERRRKTSVWKASFTYTSFNRSKDILSAVKNATAGLREVDVPKTDVDETNRKITIHGKIGEVLRVTLIFTRLRSEGFQGLRIGKSSYTYK